ncbi:MAG TPA: LON peptidase substrate-binding domain-containing protein, partial [Candidatus Eisenbacteria bacterium]
MQFSPKSPVPVFPLPNLVLFPHAVVPLHVFELRYRTMVRDALSGERVIAMGLLKPGWERDYQGSPEYYPLACLARFEEVEWLPNDCYSLVVRGLARATLGRIVREYPYRAARVELLPQEP